MGFHICKTPICQDKHGLACPGKSSPWLLFNEIDPDQSSMLAMSPNNVPVIVMSPELCARLRRTQESIGILLKN